MLRAVSDKISMERRVCIFSILLLGWLEGFVVEMLRLNYRPLSSYGTTLMLASIGAIFMLSGIAVKFPPVVRRERWIPFFSLPWMALCLFLASRIPSGSLWGLLQVLACLPLVYLCLRFLSIPSTRRRRTFLVSWIGMTLVAGILIILVNVFPGNGRLVYALAMIPLAAATLILPGTPPYKQPLHVVKPGRVGVIALALFFILGLAASEATHWVGRPATVSWSTAVFLCASSFLVLTAVPLAFQKTRHLMAYLSAVFLSVDLLGFVDPGTRVLVLGLQVVLLVASNLLSLWWSISLLSALRQAPGRLGLALGTTALAVALGWSIPSALGPHPSVFLMLMAILMVVVITPFVLSSPHAQGEERRAPYRGNPEILFSRAKLTPQERRIVQLLLQGYSNQAILKELYVSINTLKTHLKNIYRKTETKNRRELIDLIGEYHEQTADQ